MPISFQLCRERTMAGFFLLNALSVLRAVGPVQGLMGSARPIGMTATVGAGPSTYVLPGDLDEEALLAQSTFPIKPPQLIELAKRVFGEYKVGLMDETILAEDFEFCAPFVGPLKKAPYLAALRNFKIEDAFPGARRAALAPAAPGRPAEAEQSPLQHPVTLSLRVRPVRRPPSLPSTLQTPTSSTTAGASTRSSQTASGLSSASRPRTRATPRPSARRRARSSSFRRSPTR